MDTKRKPTRKERTLATRRRIWAAAYKLFRERGYPATTMDAIAEEAGVAVQTLYFTFHKKATILEEVMGAAIVGFEHFTPQPADFDGARAPQRFMPWWPAFEAAPDGKKALAIFVDANLAICRRAAPLMVATQARASNDPDAQRLWDVGEKRRVDSFREMARVVMKKEPHFKHGVTLAYATEMLLVYASATLYEDLTSVRGWSVAECRRFINASLQFHLYGG